MELTVRYSGEEKVIEKIYEFLLYINKTIKLHTLFTRAGLNKILARIGEDKENDVFSFLLDITEAFRCYLIDIEKDDTENKFIKELSKKIGFKLPAGDLENSLLPTEVNDSFVSSEDVELLIKNNIWLLPVVMIRFANFYSKPKDAKSN